ncbi:MAG: hypothetical protein K6B70_04935 [Clostridia bacterium]|nr:hypothetical protein [Clostridia bacterium]
MKPGAVVLGILTSLACIACIVSILPSCGYETYTANEFHNIILVFISLEAGVICAEAVADSAAREVGIDTIIVLIVSVIAEKYALAHGIILFSGQLLLPSLVKMLFIPILFVTAWAGFNGTSGVSHLISLSKRKKVG